MKHTPYDSPRFVSALPPEPSLDPPLQIWFGNLKTGVLPLLLTEITSKVEILGLTSTREALCVSLESTDIAWKLLEYYHEMLESRREATKWWKELILEIGDGSGTEPHFGGTASKFEGETDDVITVKEELVGLEVNVAAMEGSLAPEHRLKTPSSIDSRAENLSSKISATFPPLPTFTISTVPLVIRNMPVMDEERLRPVLIESLLSDHQITSHTPILFRISTRHHHLVAFTDIRTNGKESELLGRLNRTMLHRYRISVQRAKGQPTYVQKKDTSAIIPNPGSNTGMFKPPPTNETTGLARPTASNFVHLFVDLHCHPSQKSDTYYQNKLQDLLQPYTERKLSFEMRLSSIGSRIAYVLVKSGEATKIIRFLDDSLFDGNRIRISLASPKATSEDRSVPQPTTTPLNVVNLPPANDHRKPTNFPARRESSPKARPLLSILSGPSQTLSSSSGIAKVSSASKHAVASPIRAPSSRASTQYIAASSTRSSEASSASTSLHSSVVTAKRLPPSPPRYGPQNSGKPPNE